MNPESTEFRFRTLLFSIYVPTFLMGMGLGAILPVIPLATRQLGAGLGLIGIVAALRGVGNVSMDLPSGVLVSRANRKNLMMWATGGLAAVAFIAVFCRSLLLFAVLMFLMGGFNALWMLTRLSYLKTVFPVNKRGKGLSLMGGVSRIGSFVGPVVGGLLGKYLGFSAAFGIQAICSFLAFLMVTTAIRYRDAEPVPTTMSGLQGLWHVLKTHRRSFTTAGTAIVALSIVRSGRQLLLPLWGDWIGLDVASIGLVMGLAAGLEMTLFYPAGYIMDRWGRKWTAVPCILILSLSLALIPLAHSFASLLLLSLLAGLGNGLGSGIQMTFGSDLAPERLTGEFLGLWRLVGDLGTAAGPMLIGSLAQAVTLAFAPILTAGFGLAGAVWMILIVVEPLRRSST